LKNISCPTASSPSPFASASGGVRIRVRLTPRASANRLTGLVAEAEGEVALKVMVTAPAEGGKANAALIALLSRAWRVPKRDIEIVAGVTDRRKLLHIAGDPARLLPLLEATLAGLTPKST
jgi:uncharacterized protein (TIGR00251 family)